MTMEILERVIKENNIPKDVHFMSDSGWECGPTEMDGIIYSRQSNTIIFTQDDWPERGVNEEFEDWKLIYALGSGLGCTGKEDMVPEATGITKGDLL